MDIIVCIKQVIAGDQVRFDPKTRRLVRSPDFSRVNPFDLAAIEMAAELKQEHSGSVTAVTMGPEFSEEVLLEALAMGADRAVLLSDRRFAAADTLATSYVLGKGIQKIGSYDLLLCGVRTSDSGTAQVGPQLAEELDLPYVTGVEKVEKKGGQFRVERMIDGYREVLDAPSPALFAVSSRRTVRTPSLNDIQDAFLKNAIERWNLEEIHADPERVGSAGSRTWVEELVPVAQRKSCHFIEGESRQQAKSMLKTLIEKNLVS